jgi:hypothetical protein
MNMDGAGPRKDGRKHVLLNATIIASNGLTGARVKDLSQSGVRVSCDSPLSPEGDVIFKRGTIFVAARVIWADHANAGLEFYRHLDPAELGNG